MGNSDSKLQSRKFEKHSVKYPIETTEIIASDYESLIVNKCNNLPVDQSFDLGSSNYKLTPGTLDVTNNISLSKNDLANLSTNNTIWPSDSNLIKSTDDSSNSNYPKIHKLNSQIDLLATSFDDEPTDEFKSSESDATSSSESVDLETNSSSNDYDDNDDAAGSVDTISSDTSVFNKNQLPEQNFGYDKSFMTKFKNRYSKCCDEYHDHKTTENGDNNNHNYKSIGDLDDSFTEITKIISSKRQVKNHDIPQLINVHDKVKSRIKCTPKLSSKLKSPTICNSINIESEDESDKLVHNSLTLSKSDCANGSISSAFQQNIHSSYDNNPPNFTLPGFRNLCYKFWVDATYETWKIFHNNRDRRIESIGRLSNCQIRLTKITQRSPKGMLKRQVFVYASTLGDLQKCCKLFDDKFPQFCASASLKIDNNVTDKK